MKPKQRKYVFKYGRNGRQILSTKLSLDVNQYSLFQALKSADGPAQKKIDQRKYPGIKQLPIPLAEQQPLTKVILSHVTFAIIQH